MGCKMPCLNLSVPRTQLLFPGCTTWCIAFWGKWLLFTLQHCLGTQASYLGHIMFWVLQPARFMGLSSTIKPYPEFTLPYFGPQHSRMIPSYMIACKWVQAFVSTLLALEKKPLTCFVRSFCASLYFDLPLRNKGKKVDVNTNKEMF